MDADLADQLRRETAQLDLLAARPALHRHQIAALGARLAVGGQATSVDDFAARLTASGRSYQLAAAGWCDRHANHAAVFRGLGDAELAAAIEAEVARVAAASDDRVLALWSEAAVAIEAARSRAATAAWTVGELAATAIEWAAAGSDAARDEPADLARAQWARLAEVDPGFAWADVRWRPRYRNRLPFDEARIAILGDWLAAALGHPVDSPPPSPPPSPSPSPSPSPPPSPSPFLAAGDPLVTRALDATLAAAATQTEVEQAVDAATTCFDVEVAWHELLFLPIGAAVQAASALEAEPLPSRRAAVAAAVDVLATLLGVAPAEALAAPRVDAVVDGVYLRLGQQPELPAGALLAAYGEVGLRPVPALRAAAAGAITRDVLAAAAPDEVDARLAEALARPRFASSAALRAHLVALCAGAPAAPSAPAPLRLWGRPVALASLHAIDVPAWRPPPLAPPVQPG